MVTCWKTIGKANGQNVYLCLSKCQESSHFNNRKCAWQKKAGHVERMKRDFKRGSGERKGMIFSKV